MRGRSRQRSSRVPGSGTPERYFANARPNRDSCGASCANSVRQAWNLRPAVAPKIFNADFSSITSTRSIHCLSRGPGTGYCQQACASSLNAKPKRIVQGCRPGEAAWVQRGGDQALSCRRTGRHAGPGETTAEHADHYWTPDERWLDISQAPPAHPWFGKANSI